MSLPAPVPISAWLEHEQKSNSQASRQGDLQAAVQVVPVQGTVDEQQEPGDANASRVKLPFSWQDVRVGARHSVNLLAWSAIPAVVGGVCLILPLALLANATAAYQVGQLSPLQDEGELNRMSMAAWSTTSTPKASTSFWLFWIWSFVCQRVFIYLCFFLAAAEWWRGTRAALVVRWLPAFAAAVASFGWQLGLMHASAQGRVQYSKKVGIIDVASRYGVWLATVIPCFAMCAPSGQVFRRICLSSFKLAAGGAIGWASITQSIVFFWKRAGNKNARLLLPTACAG